jgi:hypothetical protein
MSSAVQLKLLTLLNVSAIKRPFDLDVPGGHRSSPTLSRETSLTPQQPPQPATVEANGSSSSSNSRGADGEPPKKKKKGVIFGGVIGPSGSTIKDGEASKSGKKSKKSKKSEKAVDADAEAPAASVSAEASTSAFAFRRNRNDHLQIHYDHLINIRRIHIALFDQPFYPHRTNPGSCRGARMDEPTESAGRVRTGRRVSA